MGGKLVLAIKKMPLECKEALVCTRAEKQHFSWKNGKFGETYSFPRVGILIGVPVFTLR
jgi:hypothetical protein